MDRDFLVLYVNGRRYEVRGARAFETLSRWLRYELRLTGTKIVCEEGDCGACTVLIGRPKNGSLEYLPINSCIQFLFQLDCTHIITVEGLRGPGTRDPGPLTAVQEAMINTHGAQCGYCTPGFVMAMHAVFDARDKVDEQALRDGLTGNLCRCTGYDPIIKAGLAVTAYRSPVTGYPPDEMLAEFEKLRKHPIRIEDNGRVFYAPVDVPSATGFRPGAAIVQGATDVGVTSNKRGYAPQKLMSLNGIDGLDGLSLNNGDLQVGARVSLTDLENFVRDLLPELHEILAIFGSPQIKNAGTLAGNIANASPIADTLPFLYVMEAALDLTGPAGTRTVPIQSFYKGYKSLDMRPDELITQIRIPLKRDGERLRLYKVSKRKHLDISSFTAAIRLVCGPDRIDSARIAYGGVGPVVLRLPRTEGFLSGKPFTLDTFTAAGDVAREEISPITDMRGSANFRSHLAANILRKFYFDAVGVA